MQSRDDDAGGLTPAREEDAATPSVSAESQGIDRSATSTPLRMAYSTV